MSNLLTLNLKFNCLLRQPLSMMNCRALVFGVILLCSVSLSQVGSKKSNAGPLRSQVKMRTSKGQYYDVSIEYRNVMRVRFTVNTMETFGDVLKRFVAEQQKKGSKMKANGYYFVYEADDTQLKDDDVVGDWIADDGATLLLEHKSCLCCCRKSKVVKMWCKIGAYTAAGYALSYAYTLAKLHLFNETMGLDKQDKIILSLQKRFQEQGNDSQRTTEGSVVEDMWSALINYWPSFLLLVFFLTVCIAILRVVIYYRLNKKQNNDGSEESDTLEHAYIRIRKLDGPTAAAKHAT